MTILDLVRRQHWLLWSNKTFEAEIFTEEVVDVLSGDVLQRFDLGLDLPGSNKGILLHQPLQAPRLLESNAFLTEISAPNALTEVLSSPLNMFKMKFMDQP